MYLYSCIFIEKLLKRLDKASMHTLILLKLKRKQKEVEAALQFVQLDDVIIKKIYHTGEILRKVFQRYSIKKAV